MLSIVYSVRRLAMTAATGIALATAAVPAAAVTTVSSGAFDISVSLSVVNLATASLGPLTESGGSSPPAAYSNTDTTASISQNLNLGVIGLLGLRERIQTGVLTTAAQSPFPSSQTGSARASVDDLVTQLGTVFLGSFGNLLNLSAETIVSRSLVTGGAAADASGFTQIEGLSLTGTLLSGPNVFIDTAALASFAPDPNTLLLRIGLVGQEVVRIILNEQVETGNGTTDAAISTNAIRIIFSDLNVAGIGLLRGDIIVAHSEAQISDAFAAVPEPATWVQMIVGFGLAGTVVRRRRRTVHAAA